MTLHLKTLTKWTLENPQLCLLGALLQKGLVGDIVVTTKWPHINHLYQGRPLPFCKGNLNGVVYIYTYRSIMSHNIIYCGTSDWVCSVKPTLGASSLRMNFWKWRKFWHFERWAMARGLLWDRERNRCFWSFPGFSFQPPQKKCQI